MKQKQIFTLNAAVNSAQLIVAGITEVGAGVTLSHNPAADINTDLVNAIMARGNHEQAKQVKATRRNVLKEQLEEVTNFIRATRDVFKMNWGTQFSELFTGLGFGQGTLEMPTSLEDIKGVLLAIKAQLTANPTQEVGTLITAARAQELLDALMAAQQAVVSQDGEIKSLIGIRRGKYVTLRKRISGVYQELRLQLSPLDPRWVKFGFHLPGADGRPDRVTGVQAALVGPNVAAVRWDASARAGHYRVWYKVHGSEGDYVATGSPSDLDLTIDTLPANSLVDIVVTAVNSAGESAFSEVFTLTTH